MTEGMARTSERPRMRAVELNRAIHWLGDHWFLSVTGLLWLWVGIPWLAPVFMKLGWQGPANVIYTIYSFQCHQLPQRSFFLFGERTMYSLAEIQAAWPFGSDPLVLRQFIGNVELGYKVAWSDRMVAAYGSIPLAATIWWPVRKRARPLTLLGFALFSLPMFLDGTTHFISDLAGLGQGFRYTNQWLSGLTGGLFPASFYAGNELGSFNSWMRLLTGALFGFGLVWFTFPQVAGEFRRLTSPIEGKFQRAGVEL